MKKKGYDIFDFVQEGGDPVKFIQECPEYKPPTAEETVETAPFKFLGHDESRHFFLPIGSNIVKKINFGSFSKSKLLELAPLSWWAISYPQKHGFNVDGAIDDVIRSSETKGYYMPESIRGTGVWKDCEKIVVNDGLHLCDNAGKKMNGRFKSEYFYVSSEKRMGSLSGEIATDEQGSDLVKLFLAQGFQTRLEAITVLGWSLIAPFGGVLKWRPHIWITGPKSSGKSWILENLVYSLCGPFSFIGSGKDSAAGLCRALWKDPCPTIKDEMEPGKSKDTRKRIDETLEIARNASDDFAANITLANSSGGVDRFRIRSCFCFSSIVPYLTGEAIESRVSICRLKNKPNMKEKKEQSAKYISLLKDGGIFRRRIFQNLKNITSNIEFIHDIIMSKIANQRKADNLAPIFAAAIALVHGGRLDEKTDISNTIYEFLDDIDKSEDSSDEDKLMRELLDHTAKMAGGVSISIAELIIECEIEDMAVVEKKELLFRYGMRIREYNGLKYLAVAMQHSVIKNVLRDTIYSERYSEILKRHVAAIEDKPSVRFAGQTKKAVHLDWETIKQMYFGDGTEQGKTEQDLFNTF